MIDHLTVSVLDLAKSRAFYVKALAPLGYVVKMEFDGILGFGDERKPYFWLKAAQVSTTPQHIAFAARSRAAVDAFHKAALEAGAKDDGAPGIRRYHPNYYGAFVIDPHNGHPIEAVCHDAP
jgi:catechol 2,3-dioxygenase-like lactoylglutathione lyase family enzyme